MNNIVMNEATFNNLVQKEILRYLPMKYAEAKVTIAQSNKNNGVVYDSLTIKLPDNNYAPMIPLTSFYQAHLEGVSFESIMKNIAKVVVDCENNRIESIDYSSLRDWDKVKDHVRCQLVNYNLNKDKLEDLPHKRWNDLAIIYYIEFGSYSEGPVPTCKINNSILESFGPAVTPDVLHQTAMDNLKCIEYAFDIPDFLEGALPITFPILRNKDCSIDGAAQIFNEKAMDDLCEFVGEDFYMIPSSISEWIIIPDSLCIPLDNMIEMVQEVNQNVVNDTDVLSYSIYHCDFLTRFVDMVYESDYGMEEPDEEAER